MTPLGECAGKRILSIPAGPPPAISMSPPRDICAAHAETVIGPDRPLREIVHVISEKIRCTGRSAGI